MCFLAVVLFLWVLSTVGMSFWPRLLQPAAYVCSVPALFNTEVSLPCRNCPSGPSDVLEAQKGASSGDSKKDTCFQLFCFQMSVFNIDGLHGFHAKSRMSTEIVSEVVAFLVVLLVHTYFLCN